MQTSTAESVSLTLRMDPELTRLVEEHVTRMEAGKADGEKRRVSKATAIRNLIRRGAAEAARKR